MLAGLTRPAGASRVGRAGPAAKPRRERDSLETGLARKSLVERRDGSRCGNHHYEGSVPVLSMGVFHDEMSLVG